MSYRLPSGGRRIPRAAAPWVALAIAGCTLPAASDHDLEGASQTLAIAGVNFQTTLQNRFVGAQNNGGGAVIATATTARSWETFSLEDINGGSLESGDSVHIRAG